MGLDHPGASAREWSIDEAAPALWRAVRGLCAELEAVDIGSLDTPPVGPSCLPFGSPTAFRPYSHNRAFYRPLGRGVLAVKGSEVAMPQLDRALDRLAARRAPGTFLPNTDFLVHREQKVPMALTLSEAHGEAERALRVQRRYFARYGVLPSLPMPLAVFRWSDAVRRRFESALAERLRPAAAVRSRELLDRGLATYVYYYPGRPIRVRDVHAARASRAFGSSHETLAHTRAHLDPKRTIRAWVQLVAELLAIGEVPYSLSHDDLGQPVRAQNAVIDGGFVDVDAIQPIESIASAGELAETLWMMIGELAETLRELLLAPLGFVRQHHHALPVTPLVLATFVHAHLRTELEALAAGGAKLHPWLTDALLGDDGYDTLEALLGLLHPAPGR